MIVSENYNVKNHTFLLNFSADFEYFCAILMLTTHNWGLVVLLNARFVVKELTQTFSSQQIFQVIFLLPTKTAV